MSEAPFPPPRVRYRLVHDDKGQAHLVFDPVAIPGQRGWVRCRVRASQGNVGSSSRFQPAGATLDCTVETYKHAPIAMYDFVILQEGAGWEQ